MEALYTGVATSIGGRSGSVKSSDGVLDLQVRPPKEMGGPGGNYTNPEQLFAAGYAACFGSAVAHVGLGKGLKIRPEVTAHVSMGENGKGGFMFEILLEVNLPEMDQKEADKLVEEADQVCPYSNAFRNNVEVKFKINIVGK